MASALDGRWTALCQARRDTNGDGHIAVMVGYHGSLHGDAMQLYLVEGEGEGDALDDLVDATPNGRYLAYVREGRLVLRDTVAKTTVDLSALGADAERDHGPFERNRAGSFDDSGERFVWIRGKGASTRVMLRTLADRHERVIEPPPGILDRAWIDPAGAWLVIRSVARDTNGDGRLTPPRVDTTYPSGVCRGIVSSFSTRGRLGDDGETFLMPIAGGALRRVRELVEVVGSHAVLRRADGALDAVTPDGHVQPWTPADCAGRVVGFSRRLGRAVVRCTDRWRGSISIHGDGVHCALPERADAPFDRGPRRRFVHLRWGDDTSRTVDLAQATLLPENQGFESHLPTVWRARTWDGHDTLSVPPHRLALKGFLFELRVEPLAVDLHGRALLPAEDPESRSFDVPQGPLVWHRPPTHSAVTRVHVPTP